MNALLPHVLDHAVRRLTTDQASLSLGLVGFCALALMLIERDVLAGKRSTSAAAAGFTAAAIPLSVAVFVMLVVRVFVLAH
jgi:hypothetical protein